MSLSDKECSAIFVVGVEKPLGLRVFWVRPEGLPRNGRNMLKIYLFSDKIPKEFTRAPGLGFGPSGVVWGMVSETTVAKRN